MLKNGDYLIAKVNLQRILIKNKRYLVVDADEVDALIKTGKNRNSLFSYDTLYEYFYTKQELRREKLKEIFYFGEDS